jgi:hypothetical protein
MRKTTVPIGPTTLVAWGTSAVALILAIVTYKTGSTAEHGAALVEAAGGFAMGSIALVGRYLQAHKQIAVDAEQAEHALGLTTAQVEALIEQKLPELLPVVFANIGKLAQSAPPAVPPAKPGGEQNH